LCDLDRRLTPRADVDFDYRRAQLGCRFDLPLIARDEQRYANARIRQLRDNRRQMIVLAGGVEAAFGRALLASFRHDAGSMRAHA
jgi:hypothetical protein